jgi:rubrerythrin
MKAKSKDRITADFETMRTIEQSARDFYREIQIDPRIDSDEIKSMFGQIAADEQRHIERVDDILMLIDRTL